MEVGAIKHHLNNEIINIKKNLKQAKVQLIHKLTRKANALKNLKKPPPERLKVKIQRKADTAVAEVLIIKKVKPKDLVRFVISHKGTLQQHLNKPTVDNEKVFAKILLHKSMAEKYNSIREKFANMPADELLMTRKERLKLKKERNDSLNNKGRKGKTDAKKTGDEESDEIRESVENYDDRITDVSGKSENALENSSDEESQKIDESESNKSENEDCNDANILENTKPVIKKKHKKSTQNKLDVEHTEINSIKTSIKQKEIKRQTGLPEKEITKKPVVKKKDPPKQKNKKSNRPNPKHRSIQLNETAPVQAKVVDPFFLTSSGDVYMTLAEPRAPDEVKEEHYRGNRRMRRAEKFGKPIKSFKPPRNNFENDSESYGGSKYEKPLFNKANRKNNLNDSGISKRSFNSSKTNSKSLPIEVKTTDVKEEKLHPSWEAKKQKSGIVAFQGKKVVF